MLRIFENFQGQLKYTRLESKVSELETKVANLFKNMISLVFASVIITSIVTAGLVLSPVLTALTLAAEGYPFHATLLKISAIYGGIILIAAPAIILSIILTIKKSIQNNPV